MAKFIEYARVPAIRERTDALLATRVTPGGPRPLIIMEGMRRVCAFFSFHSSFFFRNTL